MEKIMGVKHRLSDMLQSSFLVDATKALRGKFDSLLQSWFRVNNIKDLNNLLEGEIKISSNVFIVGHNSPDFDSIGAAIGLSAYASKLGKKAYIIVDDDELKIEPGVKKIIDSSKDSFQYITRKEFLKMRDKDSLLIVADTNKRSLVSVKDDLETTPRVVVIDHHYEDEESIETKKKFISPESSSACEIITRLLFLSNTPYNNDVANYLLAGISLDTKSFRINTTDETHEVAKVLIKKGASIDYVNNLFLEEFENYCRISNLITNGTIIKKYSESALTPIQVSFTLNRNEPDNIYSKETYAKAADRMMKFNGIDASFSLGYVEPGVVHISARSGKRVDVGSIMERLGGGGTPQTAGGRVETDDILSLEEELMQTVHYGLPEEADIIEEPPTIKLKQIKRK